MCGVVFFRWGGASWLGCVSATGWARLGRVDKELIGIFAVSFVFGVVWRRFFDGAGRRGWGARSQWGGRGWDVWIKS